MFFENCPFKYNRRVAIERFLSENPDFSLDEPDVSFGRRTMDYAVRIFPMDGGEGHFAAKFVKKYTPENVFMGWKPV